MDACKQTVFPTNSRNKYPNIHFHRSGGYLRPTLNLQQWQSSPSLSPRTCSWLRTPMSFRATLPVEIEENVIDQLDKDFASLRNCALTCRAWVPRSRTLLLCAIRIATRSTWDAVEDYFQANPGMRPLVRSLATAPATQAERTRLLGTYPVLLFRMLPNLRLWEIRAPADATDDPPPTIFFHPTTLTQLRLSPITELHLSSIQFPLLTDLVRLLSSIPRLRVLECTEIQIARSKDTSSMARSLLLRRPLHLSTLQICQGKRADENVLPCLLELTASSLQNLVLRCGDGFRIKRSGEAGSPPARCQPLLSPIAATTPTMSQLRSLTFHAEQGPKDSVSTLFSETFEVAANCGWALRGGSKLEGLEIHVHMNDACRTSCGDPVSLALLLSEDHIQNRCRALETSLLADWNTNLSVVIHIPSSWAPREVVLRTLKENAFPKLEKKGLLHVGYSGGNACQSFAAHNGPVSALAVSPNGRWIASRSRDLVIVWDAQTQMRVHEWLLPMDQPPSADSFAFSPESTHIACGGYDKHRTFVEIRDVEDGHQIGVLRGYGAGSSDISQLICAWVPDRLLFVCLARSTILVQSWDAHTFAHPSAQEYVAPFAHGSLVLSPDGRHLVGLAAAASGQTRCPVASKRPFNPPRQRTAHRRRSRTTSRRVRPHPVRSTVAQPVLLSHPLCVLWDLDTGGPCEVLLDGLDSERVLAASFDHESRRLALSLADHTIHIWDTRTREKMLCMAEPFEERGLAADPYRRPFFPLPSEVLSKAIAFAPDGRRVFSLRNMRLRDGRTETLLADWDTLSGQRVLGHVQYEKYDDTSSYAVGRGSGLARFSPGCMHCAFTACSEEGIHAIDLSRGIPLKTQTFGGLEDQLRRFGVRPGHGDVTMLVFSPDGRTLCWGTQGGEVEISSL